MEGDWSTRCPGHRVAKIGWSLIAKIIKLVPFYVMQAKREIVRYENSVNHRRINRGGGGPL